MSDVTLKAIENLLDSKLEPINTKLDTLQETVNSHTTTLDGNTKMLIDLTTDKAALTLRLERYDKFMKIVAEKLNLNLDELLNH